MTIHWITEFLGTAAASEARGLSDVAIIDVRDLVDKSGNRSDAVREKILTGVEYLRNGQKTIVCCDYGISRSNAIAAGIVALHFAIPFLEAVQQVRSRSGEAEMKLEPLEVVRRIVEKDALVNQSGSRRTVLVTGAHGFVGSAVCKRLNDRFDTIAPSRDELDIELGATQLDLLTSQYDVGCIIHLASPRVYTSNLALGRTLTMLRNVLEVCAARHIALIYCSSWEIYSGYVGALQVDEATPAFPLGPYGETKYLAELMIRHFERSRELKSLVIRSSPVYGVGSDRPKFIHNFIEKARQGETIVTHRYTNGDAALDLLHVDDFADAITLAHSAQIVGSINVGTGMATSTRTIAEMIVGEMHSTSHVEQVLIESNTASIAMNSKRAYRILGWQPRTAFQDGLKGLLAINSQ